MKRGTNLKLTLMVRITLLAVVIGVLASAALIWRTTSRLQAEAERNADLVSRLITDQMSRQLSGLELNIGKPDLSRFAEFSEVTRLCVQYFDLEGRLSANSCTADGTRPGEYAPEWFRELIRYMLNRRIERGAAIEQDVAGEPGVRVGRRVLWYQPYGVGLDVGRAPGLKMGEVLIRVDADRESGAVWQEILRLLAGAAVAVLAFNLLIYLSISRALRPASAVLDGLGKLERGDLDARLPAFELAEFDRIGSVFNTMAENLKQKTREQQRLAQMLLTVQEGERRRLQGLMRSRGPGRGDPFVVQAFSGDELALSLGREHVIHAALRSQEASLAFLARARRLDDFRVGDPAPPGVTAPDAVPAEALDFSRS